MKTLFAVLLCGSLGFAQGGGTGQSPSAEARPVFSDAVPITRIEPEYSPEARAAKLQGTVYLYLEIDEQGRPSNVQVMHGLGMGLDEKALAAVNRWQFKPALAAGQPVKVAQSAEVEFRLGDDGTPWRVRQAGYFLTRNIKPAVVLKPVLSRYASPDSAACPADGAATIVDFQIDEDGLPRDVRPRLTDGAAGMAVAKAIGSWRFQPGLANGKPRRTVASIEFECGPPATVDRIHRVGTVTGPIPIYKPEPQYSEEARKSMIEGMVTLQLVIDASGHATQMRVVHGLGLGLDEKAMEAVALWRFKPGMKGGEPVAVQAQIQINFRLQ